MKQSDTWTTNIHRHTFCIASCFKYWFDKILVNSHPDVNYMTKKSICHSKPDSLGAIILIFVGFAETNCQYVLG